MLVIDTITSIAAETIENNDVKNLFDRVLFLKETSTKLKRLAYQNDLAVIVVNNVAAGFSEDFKKSNKVFHNQLFYFIFILSSKNINYF